jgi:hypothetical protein
MKQIRIPRISYVDYEIKLYHIIFIDNIIMI